MRPLPPQHRCTTCNNRHYDAEGRELLNQYFTTCLECQETCHYQFMVQPAAWQEARLNYHDGVIHLECLEKRLGRKLSLVDFNFESQEHLARNQGHSINDAIRWAFHRAQNG